MKRLLVFFTLPLLCVAILAQTQTPSKVDDFLKRAADFRAKDNFEAAIAEYDQAIVLKPQDALIFNLRGAARRKSANLEGALSDFDRAISLSPYFADAYHNRGLTRLDRGQIA